MNNMSLSRMLRIGRKSNYKRKGNLVPIVDPGTPGDPGGSGPGAPSEYTLADFGENAINNHHITDGIHAEKVSTIFNYVVKDFSNRCTTYMSYNIPSANNGMIDRTKTLLCAAEIDADIIMTPYVNASSYREYEYYDFVLPVSSHYDNAGSDGNPTNSNRRDITAGPEILLVNSVAVSARRDTPSTLEDSTSYGYGMEFFEDISHEAMDSLYPNKDIPTALAAVTSVDGITFTSTANPGFTQYISVGDEITIRHNDKPYEVSTVKSIDGPSSMTLNNTLSPIASSNVYAWFNVNLASYCGGQAQSWAVPLVAGKLKVIKMTTLADWDTVRAAARATAKRSPTGIPEVDNASWDMYRGFGCIDVQAAINYINNNQ